ncbi:hypothetical protein [Pedobacter polysacchareus]|uniref:hypothetical protein n=1 Tax=Pedobacter polysacchareus TaxID=2861973 RepID=UPI001C993EBA|nr:hypothetical protein [Pedobacter polysacchareus]
MQNLTKFLACLQTFDLRIIAKREQKNRINENEKKSYSLVHETQYYDSFSYRSEIRVLKDMALIDLLSLDDTRIKREHVQLKKVKERFKLFWTNFHSQYNEFNTEYPRNYIFSIQLHYLFIVKNLQPDYSDIFIGDEFVESLNDSVKIREQYLTDLINEVEEILYPRETFEKWKAKLEKSEIDKKDRYDLPVKMPYNTGAGLPKFNAEFTDVFLKLMESYFSEAHHLQLSSLINTNTAPENQLTFKGNGNQLADAFKQLYEANLIVGCLKSDLEKWINTYFVYATGENIKEYTEGWLSAIISSDTKFCKSPILEIRMKEKVPSIIPTVRNKKNSKY